MAHLDLRTRRVETSIGIIAFPEDTARSWLTEIEGRCRSRAAATVRRGAAQDAAGSTRDPDVSNGDEASGAWLLSDVGALVGFDWTADPRFARREGELGDFELVVSVRAAPGLAGPEAARRLAESSDALLVVTNEASRDAARDLAAGAAVPTVSVEGEDLDLLGAMERVVEQAIGRRTPTEPSASTRAHPLLDALRALIVDVADAHFNRVDAAIDARIDARLAADAKRIGDVDKRIARAVAELTGRATADARARKEDEARAAKLEERMDAVRRAVEEIGPGVSAATTGVGELGVALTTIGTALEAVMHAVEAAAIRGEARARRIDTVAAMLGVQDETLRDLQSGQTALAKLVSGFAAPDTRPNPLEAELRAARRELAEVSARTAALTTATTERLERVEASLARLRKERSAPDPETTELLREVTELCEELKKRKKGWFG